MNSRPYSSWATAPPRPQTRIWFRNKVSWIQRILLPNSQAPGITGIYSNCPNISFQVDFKITLLPAKITYYDFLSSFVLEIATCHPQSAPTLWCSELTKPFCAHLMPFTHSQTPSWEMRAQSRPGWSKAAMCFLIPAWCYLRRKTEPQAFPGASDPHLQTLTGSLWPCEDKCVLVKNSALFEAGFLALKRLLLSSSFHIHETATISNLKALFDTKYSMAAGTPNSKDKGKKKNHGSI